MSSYVVGDRVRVDVPGEATDGWVGTVDFVSTYVPGMVGVMLDKDTVGLSAAYETGELKAVA